MKEEEYYDDDDFQEKKIYRIQKFKFFFCEFEIPFNRRRKELVIVCGIVLKLESQWILLIFWWVCLLIQILIK